MFDSLQHIRNVFNVVCFDAHRLLTNYLNLIQFNLIEFFLGTIWPLIALIALLCVCECMRISIFSIISFILFVQCHTNMWKMQQHSHIWWQFSLNYIALYLDHLKSANNVSMLHYTHKTHSTYYKILSTIKYIYCSLNGIHAPAFALNRFTITMKIALFYSLTF